MATRKLEIEIAGDASNARRALGQIERDASSMGSKLAEIGRTVGLALGGAALGGVYALGRGLSFAVDEAREAARVNAQTAQVISTMGAGAWTSADGVAGLATKLSNLSGIDDELIQHGANVILTFGNIRNAAGEGNDVFDRTVGLANDMSVALGQDMQSSSIMLGKALNDPIRGLTALRRVGVQFTVAQEDQIKVLMESGDLLGAQRVLLDEVGRQFGGTAEAVATPWDRLKVTMGNLAEQVGTNLVPKLDLAASWLADKLPGAIAWASNAWETVLKPTFEAIGRFIEDPLIPFLGELWHGFQRVWDIIVIGAVAAWHAFQAAWDPIVRIAVAAWQDWIQPAWEALVNFVYDYIRPALAFLWQAFQGAWNIITSVAVWAWHVIQPIWDALVKFVYNYIRPTLAFLWRIFQGVWNVVVVGAVAAWHAFQGAWNIISRVAVWAWQNVIQPLVTGVSWMAGTIANLLGWLGGVWWNAWSWMANIVGHAFGGIVNIVKGIINGVLWAIERGINMVIDGVNAIIRLINRVPGINLPVFGGVNLPRLAEGGVVTRPTLAVLGEAGPEAIMPLDRILGNGGGGITIVVQGNILGTEREIIGILQRAQRRGLAGV